VNNPGLVKRTISILLICAGLLVACTAPSADYLPVSAIARNGFARDAAALRKAEGSEIRLWGYVDYANLYGDAAAKEILGEWWSGDGPSAAVWRFNLMAGPEDPAGRSFAVHVTSDAQRDELLRTLVTNAEAARPTKVFVTGTLSLFDAPTNAARLTGLTLNVQGSEAILVE
jgi:hypothetical protein